MYGLNTSAIREPLFSIMWGSSKLPVTLKSKAESHGGRQLVSIVCVMICFAEMELEPYNES
jgi:hypothetical protein